MENNRPISAKKWPAATALKSNLSTGWEWPELPEWELLEWHWLDLPAWPMEFNLVGDWPEHLTGEKQTQSDTPKRALT